MKQTIKHELLNIFTIMNHYLLDSAVNPASTSKLEELIKIASLLVGHEELFLGKKPQFFEQDIDLNELLESIFIIYEPKIKKNNVSISTPRKKTNLKLDRYYIQESLGQIICKLLDSATTIAIHYEESSNAIMIDHDAKSNAKLPKQALENCIAQQKLESSEIMYQLALHILETYGAEISFQRERIKIKLPTTAT